jgi:N utilization substance protein A
LAREPGHRTKIAVSSIDSKVDAVGACVGVRGSRIKNIVDELGGEKIDIVRWNESSQILISNALKPAEVAEVALCFELGRATVVVNEDQLSLAIGKRGQNVRLAARLTGWDVDILTPTEFQEGVKRLDTTLRSIEGITPEMVDKFIALGLIDVRDIEEVGVEPLQAELTLSEELAQRVVQRCSDEARIVEVEKVAKKQADAIAKASAANESRKVMDALLGVGRASAESAAEGEGEGESSDKMPGPLESAEGGAPEVMVHEEAELGENQDLSPEEQAVNSGEPGVLEEAEAPPGGDDEGGDANGDTDVAALAEGRLAPPPASPDEPR